ncbi:MAG: hypothetical protein L0211_14005 [Planctomycetaceae bacterium]|nr:hypothetical protein [Planctomycetaceae bacterium]
MPPVLQPIQFRNGMKLGLFGFIMLAGSAIAWCGWGHHFWTAMKGPTEVSLEDIAKLEDPRQLPSTWVKVKFDKAVKSNVVMEESRNGVTSIDEEYVVFQAGDRWMIASVPPGFDGHELSGQIWQNNAPLARDVVKAVSDDLKDVHQGRLFPFELEADDDYRTNWFCFAGVMAMFGGGGLLFSFVGVGGVLKGFRPPDSADNAAYGEDGTEADFEEPAGFPPSANAEVNDTLARIMRDSRR